MNHRVEAPSSQVHLVEVVRSETQMMVMMMTKLLLEKHRETQILARKTMMMTAAQEVMMSLKEKQKVTKYQSCHLGQQTREQEA
jgi:hypothetical protein